MAGELQTDYLTGKTVYFLLRNSVGQIWNGASFEAYTTANLANYDIAATEQGTASGFYVGTMPSIAAGRYSVVSKDQAGGAPAETDFSVGWGHVDWTGTAWAGAGNAAVASLANNSVTANAIDSTALAEIADSILTRDVDNVEASAAIHSLCSAILKLVSKFDLNGTNAETYRTNGSTIHMTQSRDTDASLVATKTLGVAT